MKALLKKAEIVQGHWSDPLMYPVAVRDAEEMRTESVYGNILPAMAELGGFALGAAVGYNAPSAKALDSRARAGIGLGGAALGTVVASKVTSPIFDYLRRKKIQQYRRNTGQPIADQRDLNMYIQGKSPVFIGKGDVSRPAKNLYDNDGKVSVTRAIRIM